MRRHLCAVAVAICTILLPPLGAAAETLPVDNWYAFHTRTLDIYTSADSVTSGPQPLRVGWRFDVSRGYPATAWDARIALATSREPSTLSWWPPDVVSYDPATHTYSRSGRTDDIWTSVAPWSETATAELGYAASRTMVEGRAVPAGPDVTRTLRVSLTPTTTARSMYIGVALDRAASPVQVVSATCPGSGGDDRWRYWTVSSPAIGTTITSECTLTLHNTTAQPALYSPFVSVWNTVGVDHQDVTGATSLAVTDGLGTTTLSVTPPAGAAPFGHLDRFEERHAVFESEDRSSVQDWTATFLRSFSASTNDDAITSSMTQGHGWSMLVQSWTGPIASSYQRFPAHIQVTSPTRLWPYPETLPVETPAGFVYRWDGQTPMFSANVGASGPATAGPVGFTVERTLSGGRLVPAHTSSVRSITVHVREMQPLLNLTTWIALTPMPRPDAYPASLSVTNVSCPGSVQQNGNGGTWPLAAPATEMTVGCTFTLANTGDNDALYMPVVRTDAERSRSVDTPILDASRLALTDPDIGAVEFSVEVPSGLRPNGTLVRSEHTSATLWDEARGVPDTTALALDLPATSLFGAAIPAPITLTDTTRNAPLANARVRIQLRGPATDQLFESITGADGTIPWRLSRWLLPGTYTATVTYAGAGKYLPATLERRIEIVETEGRVVAAGRGSGGPIAIDALLAGTRRMANVALTSDAFSYRGVELLALGISPNGHHAALAVRDRDGVTAFIDVDDSAGDRVDLYVDRIDRNGDGSLTGHIQISPGAVGR